MPQTAIAKAPSTKSPRRTSSISLYCCGCAQHMGQGPSTQLCGACLRQKAGQPVALALSEWRRFAQLCRLYWGDGKIRSLLLAQNGTPEGYRPTLRTNMPDRRFTVDWTDAETAHQRETCALLVELANLYDRAQASRGDARRACRSS